MGGDYTRFTFNPQQAPGERAHAAGASPARRRLNELADMHRSLPPLGGRRPHRPHRRVAAVDAARRRPARRSIRRRRHLHHRPRPHLRRRHPGREPRVGRPQIDEVLDELRGARATPVRATSRHLGAADPQKRAVRRAPPRLPDVWRREVTCVEDAGIVEKAVGVDTATRMQTAWQVRVLPTRLPDGTTCATDWSTIPAWDQATRRSAAGSPAGRREAAAPADPCVLVASAGYRGLENRLYRVEVHDDGASGPLTLKWSRDNASVAARVAGIDAGGLIVAVGASAGPDHALRHWPVGGADRRRARVRRGSRRDGARRLDRRRRLHDHARHGAAAAS